MSCSSVLSHHLMINFLFIHLPEPGNINKFKTMRHWCTTVKPSCLLCLIWMLEKWDHYSSQGTFISHITVADFHHSWNDELLFDYFKSCGWLAYLLIADVKALCGGACTQPTAICCSDFENTETKKFLITAYWHIKHIYWRFEALLKQCMWTFIKLSSSHIDFNCWKNSTYKKEQEERHHPNKQNLDKASWLPRVLAVAY